MSTGKPITRRRALAGLGGAAMAWPIARLLGVSPNASAAESMSAHGMPGHSMPDPSGGPIGAKSMAMSYESMPMIGEMVPMNASADALDHLLYPPKPLPYKPGRLREYTLTSEETEIEVAHGVKYEAWTFNQSAPGPVIRATEGDNVRVKFLNGSQHPHTVHFHGIHPAAMDGAFEVVDPGHEFVYEFKAEPAGLHLYHCHVPPLQKHIARGLYGTFIVDPKKPRKPAQELVMVMNGFDTDGDGSNNFYTVNGMAFYYSRYPIKVKRSQTVRIYLVNITEFDPINSFHLHANFFRYYPTGTRQENYQFTDTVQLCQGERGVLEIDFAYPGNYMFHAHQSEFAELGWMGFFDVEDD